MTPRPRRSGPADEDRWWDPADQAWAEGLRLRRRDFGRGWLECPMVNNVERRDHLGPGEASDRIAGAGATRGLTALDEGRAWRRRHDGVLAVLRVEVFEATDDGAHRQAWQADATAALDETWRERWRERDRAPGWVEATWRLPADRPDPLHVFDQAVPEPGSLADRVDWLQIEDHTGAAEADAVTAYQYLVVWLGRATATLTIRHRLGLDMDPSVIGAVTALGAAER